MARNDILERSRNIEIEGETDPEYVLWGWICPECGAPVSKGRNQHDCWRIGQTITSESSTHLLYRRHIPESERMNAERNNKRAAEPTGSS